MISAVTIKKRTKDIQMTSPRITLALVIILQIHASSKISMEKCNLNLN